VDHPRWPDQAEGIGDAALGVTTSRTERVDLGPACLQRRPVIPFKDVRGGWPPGAAMASTGDAAALAQRVRVAILIIMESGARNARTKRVRYSIEKK